MAYFRDGAFIADPWARRIILSVPDWQERRGKSLPSPLGLRIEPGLDIDKVGADLAGAGLIKIEFPKFVDGRGYSIGWVLRSRFGYKGEMRAIGDVLFDQMQFMMRCGFDSFEIADEETLRLLKDGRRTAAFHSFYQPGLEPEMPAGTRPWARRQAAEPDGNHA